VPKEVARKEIGDYGVGVMTELRGSSNHKAKSLLPWTLKWPTWRQGFKDGLKLQVRAMKKGPNGAAA